jgi:hypothetical protein
LRNLTLLAAAVSVLLLLTVGCGRSQNLPEEKVLPVRHYHQAQVLDWTGGRKEPSPSGIPTDPRWFSCWPVCVSEVVTYWKRIADSDQAFSNEVSQQYYHYADYYDGAHTSMIAPYLENRFGLYCRIVECGSWSSDRKWSLLIELIDRGIPAIVSIDSAKLRPNDTEYTRIFPHALVVVGYKGRDADPLERIAVVNDPAGQFTFSRQKPAPEELAVNHDPAFTGDHQDYQYERFIERRVCIIAPLDKEPVVRQLLE